MAQITLRKIAPLLAGALMAVSCSSSKQVTSSVAQREDVKGTWVLNTITYDGLPAGQKVKITLLDEGTDACLTGSTWVLPNNGNGSYTLNSSAAGCMPGQRNIVWSYQKNGDQAIFQYKILPGGIKPKNVTDGYRFKLVSASETAMQLQSEVSFEGKPVYINYSFSKQ